MGDAVRRQLCVGDERLVPGQLVECLRTRAAASCGEHERSCCLAPDGFVRHPVLRLPGNIQLHTAPCRGAGLRYRAVAHELVRPSSSGMGVLPGRVPAATDRRDPSRAACEVLYPAQAPRLRLHPQADLHARPLAPTPAVIASWLVVT